MEAVSGIVIFFLIWWTVIFLTLPFGNKRAENVTPGHAGSAPVRHNMGRKAIATTIITILLWYPVHTAFTGFLDKMRSDARAMSEADDADQEKAPAPLAP